MSLPPPTVRHYLSPSWILEINASQSLLSRWVKRPRFQEIVFQLSLDDPRLPGDQALVLQGDRPQLTALHRAVETYVQTLLAHPLLPPARLSAISSQMPPPALPP
ncbi:hypothetical protein DO97_03350 [Neosynechococcus sphagnicola sy1]|uniref:Uncharacterized protein n=2 Tax=Neosynechococcus TaxID=1501143 RepID=A0A098TLF2_9CYAN|nr:hypothetical protein DO97_03350 [Neosynechococcus sphagnicola sy1]